MLTIGISAIVLRVPSHFQRPIDNTHKLVDVVPLVATLLAVTGVMVSAIPFLFRPERFRNLYAADADTRDVPTIARTVVTDGKAPSTPFEIEQLASYYSLTLGQARISFWFSLIFAAIGFMIIVGGAALYTEGGLVGATIKIVSGVVVDAVSALFFVQSRRSQEAMSAFFEKLRSDRQFAEARKICDEITDNRSKDHLKSILVLHYSGLAAGSMIDALPARVSRHDPNSPDHPRN